MAHEHEFPILDSSTPPHPIRDDNIYRLWSMVSQKSQSFLKMKNDKGQLSLVFDGNVDEPDFVNIEAEEVGTSTQKLFRLQFADPKDPKDPTDPTKSRKVYMIAGKKDSNGKLGIVLEHVDNNSKIPERAKFEAIVFYAFTMFRCYGVGGDINLFLASDRDGKVLLMDGGVIRYPNPAMLFIANQVTKPST